MGVTHSFCYILLSELTTIFPVNCYVAVFWSELSLQQESDHCVLGCSEVKSDINIVELGQYLNKFHVSVGMVMMIISFTNIQVSTQTCIQLLVNWIKVAQQGGIGNVMHYIHVATLCNLITPGNLALSEQVPSCENQYSNCRDCQTLMFSTAVQFLRLLVQSQFANSQCLIKAEYDLHGITKRRLFHSPFTLQAIIFPQQYFVNIPTGSCNK